MIEVRMPFIRPEGYEAFPCPTNALWPRSGAAIPTIAHNRWSVLTTGHDDGN